MAASRAITSPGLYSDEVGQLVPALSFVKGGLDTNAFEAVGLALNVGGHTVHVMTVAYSGPVKNIAAIPVAAVFDLTPRTIREFSILLAALGPLATYLFTRRLFRDAAVAAAAVVLLAANPAFVSYSRDDFPPIGIRMLTKAFAGWQLLRWWQTLYILHSRQQTIEPVARSRFFAGLRALHARPTLVRIFDDRDGRFLFAVYRVPG